MYIKLTSFIKQYKNEYIKGIIYILFINILQLSIPRITGNAIDRIKDNAIDDNGLLMYSVIICVIALLIFAMHYLSRVHIIGAANLYDYIVRNNMFKHLLRLSMSFFNKKSVGEIMALSNNDLSAVKMALGRGITLVANTIFLLVFSMIILIKTVDLRLTLFAFAPFPILVFIMSKFAGVIHSRFKAVQESFSSLTQKVQENISGIRVIKAFSQEEAEIDKFKMVNEDNFKINMQLAKVSGLFMPLITLVASLSSLIVLVFGGQLVIKNEITLGDFVAFNSYIALIIHPIGFIGMIVNFVQRGRASLERIEELFREKPEVEDANSIRANDCKLKGKIEFKDLTFSYEENQKPVLNKVNMVIEAGKTVAFVGKIGSGKSTIANLILRMYNPSSHGQLMIDNIDIMDIPLKTLRDSVGYVPQDNFLFSDTISSNIGFAPREYKVEEIEDVAKMSKVYDSIISFPNKFDTILGERGVNISGGQKQRISIARAFIKEPSIIILDDCLSAVDTATEQQILSEIKAKAEDITCIMIAHRISTVKDADEIFVLEQGEVIERGTHEELLEREGYYYRMYRRQLLEDEIGMDGEEME